MLEGYKAIDGIVKHEGRNMLLAVYPEAKPDLGEISRIMQLSSLLSKQGNVLHECICFTLSGHEIVSKVIEYDQFAGYQEEDTYNFILSDEPPDAEECSECNDCIHSALCSGNNLPVVNCGSCCNNGMPSCSRCSENNMHIFHPVFMTNSGFEVVNVDAENMVIEYDSFYSVNNKLLRLKDKEKPCLTSQELTKTWAQDMSMDDPFVKLMARFNGTITALEKDVDQ